MRAGFGEGKPAGLLRIALRLAAAAFEDYRALLSQSQRHFHMGGHIGRVEYAQYLRRGVKWVEGARETVHCRANAEQGP